MRSILSACLLCLFALLAFSAPAPAQGMNPESGEVENPFHYVPPSARQSVEIGDFYLRRKDYPGALSRYKEATKDDPYYAPAYLGLGKVYEKMGKKRDALASYRKYLAVLPSKKQADDAAGVHSAIRRLERQLRKTHERSPVTLGSASTAGN